MNRHDSRVTNFFENQRYTRHNCYQARRITTYRYTNDDLHMLTEHSQQTRQVKAMLALLSMLLNHDLKHVLL